MGEAHVRDLHRWLVCLAASPRSPAGYMSYTRDAIGLLAVTVTTAIKDDMHLALKHLYLRRVTVCHDISTCCVAKVEMAGYP